MAGEVIGSPELEVANTFDRVVSVFAFIPDREFRYKDLPYIHRAFQELSLEYPELFGGLSFGKYGQIVRSDYVDDALNAIDQVGYGERFVGLRGCLILFNTERFSSFPDRFQDLGVDEAVSEHFVALLRHYEQGNGADLIQTREPSRADLQ